MTPINIKNIYEKKIKKNFFYKLIELKSASAFGNSSLYRYMENRYVHIALFLGKNAVLQGNSYKLKARALARSILHPSEEQSYLFFFFSFYMFILALKVYRCMHIISELCSLCTNFAVCT